jgi:formiminoglutamase
MKSKYPILIVIPHGGYSIPEELSEYAGIDEFSLFMEADSCANEIFAFRDSVAGLLDTGISRLFVDLNRPYQAVPPKSHDGVIRKTTTRGKELFAGGCFPDEIAIAGLLKRYYFPFHDRINSAVKSGKLRLIIECHTVAPVGPDSAGDAGRPRPVASVENIIESDGSVMETCRRDLASGLLSEIENSLRGEDDGTGRRFAMKEGPSRGYIMKKYGHGAVPLVRLNISRSLFLNEKYFSYEYLRVDEIRIRRLRAMIWKAIERFSAGYL